MVLLLIQAIDEHKDMQSALGSLVDVKHNEEQQELEDELANLLSKDEPTVSSPEKYIPGICFCLILCNILTVINFGPNLQTFQLHLITVWKVKIWTYSGDSNY